MPRRLAVSILTVLLSLPAAFAQTEGAKQADALAAEGVRLYRDGSFAAALKKLDAAIAAGHQGAEVLYMAGECYKETLNNADKSRELKGRAVPLLEKSIASGGAVSDHYYLASIYMNDLSDEQRAVEVARKGVALAGKGKKTERRTDFWLGEMHQMAGNDRQAVSHLQKFVDSRPAEGEPGDRGARTEALYTIAETGVKLKNYDQALTAYAGLMGMEPGNDQVRHQAALAALHGGDPLKAASIWRGAKSDELRTEFMYLANVASRYERVGSPKTSSVVPDATKLDDAALVAKIDEVARPLAVIRANFLKEKREKQESAREKILAERQAKKDLPPEEIKKRVRKMIQERKAKLSEMPDEEKKQDWERMAEMESKAGQSKIPKIEEPAEMKAGSRDFFYLMHEYIKRGHLIRNFSFEHGLVDLIFR